ncbi:MAG: CO dehydrogenase/acetyl-CoA synthase complex subunit alpha [Methanosarcina sp.]|jgi:acetyl-CoA decarbonylase/synthase complex subunit alpha|nr:CO dehydrogenase/acetyl-CoA synthase complex subunit alpha [Methanosarcina sp.]MDD4306122.1 CO dehydrogenase/acetyl-CoA synthase complex subunit alpha [Methanosarcina sp.]MDD4523563.1 CO dehydrogenase/acetyl-CoA synthase complex subunit alpha [Methanosarcina sp.]
MSKLTTGSFSIEDLESVQITINNIVGAAKEAAKEELGPMGPTPFPSIATLRDWSFTLFDRYEPVYTPMCDQCCYCTFGPCNLEGNKRGACGIDMKGQAAREFFLRCLTGCACHSAHGRHLLDHIIDLFGEDMPINMGASNVIAPNIQLVTGRQPKTLGELKPIMEYVEEEVGQLLATVHAGQEAAAIDYDNKAMMAGYLDHVGMEVSDIAQVTALGFPKSDPEAPLVEVGMGTIDASKPVIIAIGHNVAGVTYIMDYMEDNGLADEMEIGGLCCTAFDMTRYKREDRKAPYAKIVGTISKELKIVRSGIPDVIVLDEQCVRADLVEEGKKLKIPIIASNEKIMYGLDDRTNDDVDAIVEDLVSGKIPGCVMLDYEKLGELVPKVALKMAPIREAEGLSAIPTDEEMKALVSKCAECGECALACPEELAIPAAIAAAKGEDYSALEELHDLCVGCRRCEQVCNKEIPVLSLIEKAAQKAIAEEKGFVRAGRGQVSDPEIRAEGLNLVMGTTPGIIAIIGCANYPSGSRDIYNISEEFLNRNYIVAVSGCSAMDIGMYKDADGKTLYERFPGRFERGNILNTGSCVSNAHISGAVHKVAAIFASRNLSGNLAEIADYALNRVGAVGLAWGAYSQKAAAIGTGCNVYGIPAIVGPHSGKYRRALIAKTYDDSKWKLYDSRNGSEMAIPPSPEFLLTTAETWQEACVMLAKNCIRVSDNSMGRSIKLTHWMEISEKYLGVLPDDLWKFVRNEADLPLAKREMLLKMLESERGWEIDWKKKKIISGPKIKFDVSAQPTNLKRLCKEA